MQISQALSRRQYLPKTTIGLLLVLLYTPLLFHWVDGWLHKNISTEHEYFSHGLIGLPFAAYLCWQSRQSWQALPARTHGLGLVCLLLAVGLYSSRLPDLINLSLVVMLAGLCLWFKGLLGLRLQGFALLLVLLASPNQIPYLIAPSSLPLQKLIAGMAGFILAQGGMNVRVDQIYLFVNNRIVEVAPYCAGLKMLFTCLYVGLMLLYWTGNWRSPAKVLWFYGGIVIISIAANIVRNAMLTYFHGTGQDQAFYWLHDSWGGDLYSTAMLGSLVWLIQKIDDWVEPEFELELEPETNLEPEV